MTDGKVDRLMEKKKEKERKRTETWSVSVERVIV